MLHLSGPHRRSQDQLISLFATRPAELIDDELREAILGHGCPDYIAERAISALKASGRYDCSVSGNINLGRASDYFAEIGIDLRHRSEEGDFSCC